MHGHPIHPTRHIWKFVRRSGLNQVSLETGADLLALDQLDQKLWVALSCPVRGLELDERTLALIDTDGDGRIRAPELIAAINWAAARLVDAGDLLRGSEVMPFKAIDQKSEVGRSVAAAARQFLNRLGKPEDGSLSVEEIKDPAKTFLPGRLHGDGVITAEAAPDPDTAQLIRDIVECLGGKAGAAGVVGVTAAQIEAFYSELEAFSDWNKRGTDPALSVIGEGTAAGFTALEAVRAKVEDYFARCLLAEFNPESLSAGRGPEDDGPDLSRRSLTAHSPEIAALPLARIESGKPLPLKEGANPAWAERLADLVRDAVVPIFGPGKSTFTAEEWEALAARFTPYQTWLAAKAGARVEPLGLGRVRAILGGGAGRQLAALVEQDRELGPGFAAMADVDRLVRYYRDLRTLLRNFVNFADFYSRDRRPVFQAGTLFLDSRSCDLCLRADNPAQHSVLAVMSRLYIAYLECKRPGSENLSVAACVTQGDSNYLFVGRNGIFYDRRGRDWDAIVVKLVENPISVRQAFFTPYKRVAGFVQDQITKFAAAKDQAASASLGQAVGTTAQSAEAAKSANQSFDIAKFAGIFAALGLAVGAIGGAVASVAVGFMRLAPWQMPLAIAGALLILSGPSMVIAAIKLHQRNLGPVLEASGWAVNGRVKINFPLGRFLTQRAVLPRGAKWQLHDPFRDKGAQRRRVLLFLLILAVVAALAYAKMRGLWPFEPGTIRVRPR